MGHAHGEHGKLPAKATFQLVAQFTKFLEVRPYIVRTIEERRDAHQPREFEPFQPDDSLAERTKLDGRDAALAFLESDVDFDEHSQLASFGNLCPRTIKFLRQRKIIHRIDAMKIPCRTGRFVALQV